MSLSEGNDPTETLVWIFSQWLSIPENTKARASRGTGVAPVTLREFVSRKRRLGKTGISFNHGMALLNFLQKEEGYESAFKRVQYSESRDRDEGSNRDGVEPAHSRIPQGDKPILFV